MGNGSWPLVLCLFFLATVPVYSDEKRWVQNVQILSMGKDALVLWETKENVMVTVYYTSGEEKWIPAENGVLLEAFDTKRVKHLCLSSRIELHQYCIEEDLIKNVFLKKLIPVDVTIEKNKEHLESTWEAKIPEIDHYVGVWIAGISHHVFAHLESDLTHSKLDDYNPCERYIFALYGVFKNYTWVEMSHASYDAEQYNIDLQAFPYKVNWTVLVWKPPADCGAALTAELVIRSKSKTRPYTINLIKGSWMLSDSFLNETCQLTVVGRNREHNFVLSNSTRTFTPVQNHQIQFLTSTVDQKEIVVTWRRQHRREVKLILLWREGTGFKTHEAFQDGQELRVRNFDFCDSHELIVFEKYPNNTIVNIGELLIETDWEKLQEINLYPLGEKYLIHWKPHSDCYMTVFHVNLTTGEKTFSVPWERSQRYSVIKASPSGSGVNITFSLQHAKEFKHTLQVGYKIEHHPDLLRVQNIKYEKNFLAVLLDIPPIANTDIALIWLHKGLYHHMEIRSSSDLRPVELTITSCIDYQLNVVRLLSPTAREFMGSVDIQPGKIEISKVLTFGNQAHIRFQLNRFCQMKHFHAQVNHSPDVPTPLQSVSNDQIQLSPLVSCVNYDVQLIAYYVPESYSVSRVMRIALPAAHDENKVHLSTEDNNLLIEWKARAACQLKKCVITVIQNNEPWKKFDHTGAGSSVRIPLEQQYSTYAVSIKFIYANDFSEMSEIVSIVYGPQTPNILNLTVDLHPNRMDLLWTGSGLYQPLFYRVDGVYDNGNEISKVVTGHRCAITLEPDVKFVNVIVAAVDANGERKVSSHRTVWPKRVPPAPKITSITNAVGGLEIAWDLNSTDQIDEIQITMQQSESTWLKKFQQPAPVGLSTFDFKCPAKSCTFTMRSVNHYGSSFASSPVHHP